MKIHLQLVAACLALALSALPADAAAQDGGSKRGKPHAAATLDLDDEHRAGKRSLVRQQAYLQTLHTEITPSVVFIVRESGTLGTGFYVDANGLVLTHLRVVGDQETVEVRLSDGKTVEAPVVERSSESLGLALIDVPLEGTRPMLLTDIGRVQTGSWLGSVVYGYASTSAIRTGHLSSMPSDQKRKKFQVQIPMDASASGAPIFDVDGHVVGVADAAVGESRGINLGVRSDKALDGLDTLRERCVCLRIEAPKGKPIFVNGRIVGKGPEAVVLAHPGEHEVFSIISGRMKKTTVDFPRQQRVVLE